MFTRTFTAKPYWPMSLDANSLRLNDHKRIFAELVFAIGLLTSFAMAQTPQTPKYAHPAVDLVMILQGRVATDDGTVPNNTLVERVCNGSVSQQVYATPGGDFSMQMRPQAGTVLDASAGPGPDTPPTQPSPPASEAPRSTFSSVQHAVRDSEMGIPRYELLNCELRASAAGFRSRSISLANLTPSGTAVDVGAIVLLRATEIKGMALSVIPYKAPPNARKAYEKGLEAEKNGKLAEAHRCFEKAVEIYPRYASGWFQLGAVLEKENRRDSARAAYTQAAAIDMTFLPPYLSLASMAYEAGNWTEVRRLAGHILDLQPVSYTKVTEYILELDELTLAEAHFYNAVANYKLNKIEEAEKSIATLEQACTVNGASWKTHLLLALAEAQLNQFPAAEKHAERAATLAGETGAYATFLLGEIQSAQGKWEPARITWQQLVQRFPQNPIAQRAKDKLLRTSQPPLDQRNESLASLPLSALPATISFVTGKPWAPPDTDSTGYATVADAPCYLDETLARSRQHLKAQIGNFEKFTATEHIEHQEIARDGVPGPVRTRDFSYLVFVHQLNRDAIYLEESRDGGVGTSFFPTSLASVGLNGLGVSALQNFQNGLTYRCEGLANMHGQEAWQIRFEGNSIRSWRKNGTSFRLPVKGRIWISATSYDLLRIETDLVAPVTFLELNRDHLVVDYGPVAFAEGKKELWLPWSAEAYMELHGHRYHHRHLLTNYMLFSVDTDEKFTMPQALDPPSESGVPPHQPAVPP